MACFDGDPHTTGNAVADSGLTLARTESGWTITAASAESAAAVTGADPAPAGGWTIPFVVAGIDGVNAWFVVREFAPPLFVPEGGTVSVDSVALVVTIA